MHDTLNTTRWTHVPGQALWSSRLAVEHERLLRISFLPAYHKQAEVDEWRLNTDTHLSNAAQAGLDGRMAVESGIEPNETDSYPSNVVQAGIGGRGRSIFGLHDVSPRTTGVIMDLPMEAPKMTWTREEAWSAADKSPCLSALLEMEGFYEAGALRWLGSEHMDKFLDALDANESRKLRDFAARVCYTSYPSGKECLWLLDQLSQLDDGHRLVARLAIFERDWVTRWWKWKAEYSYSYSQLRRKNLLADVLVHVLVDELRSHMSGPPNDAPAAIITTLWPDNPASSESRSAICAAIITLRPELMDELPDECLEKVLQLAVKWEKQIPDLAKVLAIHRLRLPSDAVAIIDGLIKGRESDDQALLELDKLVAHWKDGSDLVVQVVTKGHEHLDAILHSPWRNCDQPRDDALWADGITYKVGEAIAVAARAVPDRFRLELGFSVGVRLAKKALEPSEEAIRKEISELGIFPPTKEMVGIVSPMAQLWAALYKLAEFMAKPRSQTEVVGLQEKVKSLVLADPLVWAQALPWVLVRDSALGHIAEAVTFALATISEEVRNSLENACNHKNEAIRLKAFGLRTLLRGVDNPRSDLARTLADAAAYYMDGDPIFPHPLAVVSATWLGSVDVERAIARGVKCASERFAVQVRDQGGHLEEALTEALVKEIEVEFRNLQPRLRYLDKGVSRTRIPVLSVRQRPTSKKSEEPVYGCDIAWLLKGTIPGHLDATWVDLVQVKKSSALYPNPRIRADAWKIDCSQLHKILTWSATAAYWLIASSGEILVIPAKHLMAIERGTGKKKTFTVGYHQVRSAAIPLEQYLVDLLIGQWVGTSSKEVIQFALGENVNIRPRLVIEVTISAD